MDFANTDQERELKKAAAESSGKAWRAAHWAVAFRTVTALVCFTALAVYFQHWWIALFAVLFSTSVSASKSREGDD